MDNNKKQISINRIRLEFKDINSDTDSEAATVLIESDWNLKYVARIKSVASASINRIRLEFKARKSNGFKCGMLKVLIESDWNLKDITYNIDKSNKTVLIESDWNLKSDM